MAQVCCICGKTIVKMQRVILQMKYPVCFDCVRAAGHTPGNWMGAMTTSPEKLRAELQEKDGSPTDSEPPKSIVKSPEQISVTRSVGNIFMVDEKQRYWYALNAKGLMGNLKSNAYSFNDVL